MDKIDSRLLRSDFTERVSPRDAFSKGLYEVGKENKNVLLLTADLSQSLVRIRNFIEEFPERYFNFGVAEQNMMGAAAGLATCGKIPFVTSFACFASMRTCEQVKNDIAYPRLNVKIVGGYCGVALGKGGTTHHATEDIAIMRSIANMVVLAPADAVEVGKAIKAAAEYDGPIYIRIGRDPEPVIYRDDYPFEIGKALTLRKGRDVTVMAAGKMVYLALLAAKKVEDEGIDTRVINVHTIKPLDRKNIIQAARECRGIVTVEEHNILGGLGEAVAGCLAEEYPVPMRIMGFKDTFCGIGPADELLEKHGLTPSKIAERIREIARL